MDDIITCVDISVIGLPLLVNCPKDSSCLGVRKLIWMQLQRFVRYSVKTVSGYDDSVVQEVLAKALVIRRVDLRAVGSFTESSADSTQFTGKTFSSSP